LRPGRRSEKPDHEPDGSNAQEHAGKAVEDRKD
jgi:hypothetical protein